MNYLSEKRKSLGLTQTDIETITGIDTSTLSLYENGLRVPSVENAKILGKVMNFDWTILFKETDDDAEGA